MVWYYVFGYFGVEMLVYGGFIGVVVDIGDKVYIVGCVFVGDDDGLFDFRQCFQVGFDFVQFNMMVVDFYLVVGMIDEIEVFVQMCVDQIVGVIYMFFVVEWIGMIVILCQIFVFLIIVCDFCFVNL